MGYSRPWMFSGLLMIIVGLALLWRQEREPSAQAEPPKTTDAQADQWRELFDGKTLAGWKMPEFGGEGHVEVKDGRIVLETGNPMTGTPKPCCRPSGKPWPPAEGSGTTGGKNPGRISAACAPGGFT